jgi:hypothetical protein
MLSGIESYAVWLHWELVSAYILLGIGIIVWTLAAIKGLKQTNVI